MTVLISFASDMYFPINSQAAETKIPTKVEVHKASNSTKNSYAKIIVDHSDGSVTKRLVNYTEIDAENFNCSFDNPLATPATPCGEFIDIPSEPGVVVAVTGLGSRSGTMGDGYSTSTDCSLETCVTAALKEKPQTNVTQVYNVPGTGLPDGLTKSGAVAASIGGLGLLVVLIRRELD